MREENDCVVFMPETWEKKQKVTPSQGTFTEHILNLRLHSERSLE